MNRITVRHALQTVTRVYRELDYVNRRTLELRTGVDLIDPRERLARSPRRV